MPEAQLAMSRPILYHRTADFRNLLLETRRNLQQILKTENEIIILSSSGTGAMEATVCNLLSPGERALAVVAGKFGRRWEEICKAFRIPCATLKKNFGEAASAAEISKSLGEQEGTRVLFLQGCESSTATSHDLESIGSLIREEFPELLIVVDAITTLGSEPLETDRWGLDVVISGSQKAFALPPGLAFLSISPRALQRIRNTTSPRYYFDLLKELEAQREGETAFTPPVSLIAALNETTGEILRQGLAQVIAEADVMARCTRKGLSALGFRLLSTSPSRAATAVIPPDDILAPNLAQQLEERFAIKVAGGQGELKGKILRIAHLGYFDLPDVFSLLSAVELCLLAMGAKIELGVGIRAALREASQARK